MRTVWITAAASMLFTAQLAAAAAPTYSIATIDRSDTTELSDIRDSGRVVGSYFTNGPSGEDTATAFTENDGSFTLIPDFIPLAINNGELIAGMRGNEVALYDMRSQTVGGVGAAPPNRGRVCQRQWSRWIARLPAES